MIERAIDRLLLRSRSQNRSAIRPCTGRSRGVVCSGEVLGSRARSASAQRTRDALHVERAVEHQIDVSILAQFEADNHASVRKHDTQSGGPTALLEGHGKRG